MMESIKICRFKTFLEQCFDKEPSCPFLLHVKLLRVKNCVLYIDISVEFAFDSCVEICKFLKSGNTTEMTETRSQNFTAIHRSSVKFRSGICRFKTFCMRIFARKTFLRFRCSSIHVKMHVLLTIFF